MTRPMATQTSEEGGGHGGAAAPPSGRLTSQAWRRRRALAVAVARRHWLACLFLAAGLVLRVLAQIAYQPALIYVDTAKYLYGAYPGSDPLGYEFPLKVLVLFGGVATVAAVQHLLGLAMAAGLYVLLVRRGINRWLAACAIAPVLLDAYQLQMEQTIMPDVWFEALLVAGLLFLLWRPVVSVPCAAAAGVLLGTSATMWQTGELLVIPAVLFLLVSWGGWRRAVSRSVALGVAFAVPILTYCAVCDATTGHFWLSRGQTSIGRLTYAADCATLRVPADVRALCPTPAEQAQGPDWLEHSGQSPLYTAPVPHGTTRAALMAELGAAIRHQQPLRVAGSIARDSVRLFALTRDGVESVTPISRWQFQDRYPVYPPWVSLHHSTIMIGLQQPFRPFHFVPLSPANGGQAGVIRPLASFLHAYQVDGGYTPGPLYLVTALLGLAGSVLLLRRRLSPGARQAALACLLFTACAVVVLVAPDVYEFSWRYELSAVFLLPVAGVLAISALLRWRRTARQPVPAAAPAGQATESAGPASESAEQAGA
jgi:hypothetical protein